MLTEEQAHQLNLNQHALEAAEIGYNNVSNKLAQYDNLLASIKNNYASYSPAQKARLSALIPQLSAKYNELKQQRYKYFMDQYEAQQQISYYNDLAAQQPTSIGTRRKVTPPKTFNPITDFINGIKTKANWAINVVNSIPGMYQGIQRNYNPETNQVSWLGNDADFMNSFNQFKSWVNDFAWLDLLK